MKLFSFFQRDELLKCIVCVDPSDYGYTHDVFGDVCVATSFAAPVPQFCPEGKTYQHTRG